MEVLLEFSHGRNFFSGAYMEKDQEILTGNFFLFGAKKTVSGRDKKRYNHTSHIQTLKQMYSSIFRWKKTHTECAQ